MESVSVLERGAAKFSDAPKCSVLQNYVMIATKYVQNQAGF